MRKREMQRREEKKSERLEEIAAREGHRIDGKWSTEELPIPSPCHPSPKRVARKTSHRTVRAKRGRGGGDLGS
jgi:hypothetical protein